MSQLINKCKATSIIQSILAPSRGIISTLHVLDLQEILKMYVSKNLSCTHVIH